MDPNGSIWVKLKILTLPKPEPSSACKYHLDSSPSQAQLENSKFFHAQAEPSLDFDAVIEQSRASPAQTFWLELEPIWYTLPLFSPIPLSLFSLPPSSPLSLSQDGPALSHVCFDWVIKHNQRFRWVLSAFVDECFKENIYIYAENLLKVIVNIKLTKYVNIYLIHTISSL